TWRVLACVTLLESTVLGSQWFEAERAAGVASETAQPVKNIPGSGEGCQATRQAPAGDIAGDGWSTPGELRTSAAPRSRRDPRARVRGRTGWARPAPR